MLKLCHQAAALQAEGCPGCIGEGLLLEQEANAPWGNTGMHILVPATALRKEPQGVSSSSHSWRLSQLCMRL